MGIVELSAVERVASLLEREVTLEVSARELLPGRERDKLLAELEQLVVLIKTQKVE